MLEYLIEVYYSMEGENPGFKKLIDQLLTIKELEYIEHLGED